MKSFFKHLFRSFKNPDSRPSPRRVNLQVESLEERRLLSVGVSLRNGNLKLIGSNAADVAVVNQVGNKVVVRTLSEGDAKQQQTRFAANSVKRILFNGKNGDDIFLNLTHKPSIALGGGGNDILHGGTATDIFVGQDGNDVLIGAQGNDLLVGMDGVDLLFGGLGNDYLHGGGGNDALLGHQGDDYLDGADGNDVVVAGSGSNQAVGSDGDDLIFGGAENDTLDGGAGQDVIFGREGNDKIQGSPGDDIIFAGAGNDIVGGGTGDDLIDGGSGSDGLVGQEGNDQIYGGADADIVAGKEGYDVIDGGTGLDYPIADAQDVYYVDTYGEVNQGTGGYGLIGSATPFVTANQRSSAAISHAAFVLMHRDWLFSEPAPVMSAAYAPGLDPALFSTFRMKYGPNDAIARGYDARTQSMTGANQLTMYRLVAPPMRGKTTTLNAFRSPLSSFLSSPIPSSTSVGANGGPSTIVYVPDSQSVENSGADLTDSPSVPDAYYGVGLYGNLNGGFFSYPTTPLDPATAGLIYQFNQQKKELLQLNNNAAFSALAQQDLQRQLPFLFGG